MDTGFLESGLSEKTQMTLNKTCPPQLDARDFQVFTAALYKTVTRHFMWWYLYSKWFSAKAGTKFWESLGLGICSSVMP